MLLRTLAAVSTILMTVAHLPAFAQGQPGGGMGVAPVIEMRTGNFSPDPRVSLHRTGGVLPAGHYVVQLDGPITPERHAAMKQRGILPGEYLPENAYLTRLTAGFAAARMADLAFVRWVGPYRSEWKLDPELGQRVALTPERQAMTLRGDIPVMITLFEGETSDEVTAALLQRVGIVHYVESEGPNLIVSATIQLNDAAALATLNSVQFVEEAPEITLRNSTNRWIVQSNVLNVTPLYNAGIKGLGQVAGIMDGEVDINHCSFVDPVNPIGPLHRKILAYNATMGADLHGTHVAGTVCGDASTNDDTRGIAYEGKFVFDTIPAFTDNGVYNQLLAHHNQGARVHTNSWGNDGTTNYDGLCRGIDRFSYDREDSLVLFAVTNQSALKNPENAKNLLAVGASQDTPNQGNHCSGGVGPTADGRRKPEIYAPGCSTRSSRASTPCLTTALTGTSMASPAVAGTAMLVRQYFTDGYYPSGAAVPADAFTPTGALVKATLLNSCADMTGIAGYPSNLEGWGRVLSGDALYFAGDARKLIVVSDVRNSSGLATGGMFEQTVQVSSSSLPLRITLVFTEPPATAGAANPVINNLDLEVVSPSSTLYRGNVFSSGFSTTGGSADAKNNVEQVHIASPATGAWTVRVKGTAVTTGLQGYSVVATGDVSSKTLEISLPDGPPQYAQPYGDTNFNVLVQPFGQSVVPGSPTLQYRYDGGAYQPVALTPAGGNNYTAVLPGGLCGQTAEFYVTATGSGGAFVTDPPTAPAAVYSALVTEAQIFDDHFETNLGWTVGAPGDTADSGIWTRVDPIHTVADPEDDNTPNPGVMCYVTGQSPGGGVWNQVDNGATTLTSPEFDLTNAYSAPMSFWIWFNNTAGGSPNQDPFRVDITGDGGDTWQNAVTVGPGGTGSWWFNYQIDPLALVGPVAHVRVRFVARDDVPDSFVEAAVDDFNLQILRCPGADCVRGDINADGRVDGEDIARFSQIVIAGGATVAERCAGDVAAVADGGVTTADMPNFVDCVLAGGCP